METPHALITITLGGKEYELTYTYSDWREAERRTRLPLLPGSPKSVSTWENLPPTEEIEMQVFVGMCRRNPWLTIDGLRTLMESLTFEEFSAIELASGEAFKRDCKHLFDRLQVALTQKAKEEGEGDSPLATPTSGPS